MRYFLTIWLVISVALLARGQEDTSQLREIIGDPATEVREKHRAIIALSQLYQYENPDSIAEVIREVLEDVIEEKDSLNISRAYYLMSQINSIQGNYTEALRYDLLLRDIGTRMGNDKILSDALNNLGEDYFDQGIYSTAYDYYQQARRAAYKTGDSLLLAISTYNIGKVLTVRGQYDNARTYLQKAKELSGRIGDLEGIVYCDIELADIELKTDHTEAALEKLMEAEIGISKYEIHDLEPKLFSLYAVVHEKRKEYSSALSYYTKLGEFHDKMGNYIGVGQSKLGKGSVSMELGDYGLSRAYLEEAVAIAKETNDRELLRDSYLELAILNELEGNYPSSLQLYKSYHHLKDSLAAQQRFANLQVMHETAQMEFELGMMKEREEQQKAQLEAEEFKNNILVVILALGAVILINLYRSAVKRKRVNKVLVAHKQEIEAKSREMEGLLSMKDKFLSIISHDLRSPINSLLGTIDMLNQGHLSEKESKDLMSSLKNRLMNTRKLLDNLLDWALVQMDEINIKMKKLDLYELVQENIEFFHETNEKHIVFFNKLRRQTWIEADANMLELILRNLLVNSIKFTEEGGFIEIDTEPAEKGLITVVISDNGVGMTEEQASKLFDNSQLYSTPGTHNEQGTGLGLKLCREFVERMGGKIWVESRKGEGSTFKFTLKIPHTH